MKVSGDLPPSGAFVIEQKPNKPEIRIIRLFENVKQVDGGYTYDEYRTEIDYRPGIEMDVEANISIYLEQARQTEAKEMAMRDPKGAFAADAERVEMEQMYTDHYLDMVQAQQDITDLQIQIWEG